MASFITVPAAKQAFGRRSARKDSRVGHRGGDIGRQPAGGPRPTPPAGMYERTWSDHLRKCMGRLRGTRRHHGHHGLRLGFIYVTLERARTARKAIKVMTDLVKDYGYHSSGKSFSYPTGSGEAWVIELVGKGRQETEERGAVSGCGTPHPMAVTSRVMPTIRASTNSLSTIRKTPSIRPMSSTSPARWATTKGKDRGFWFLACLWESSTLLPHVCDGRVTGAISSRFSDGMDAYLPH